MFCFHFICCHFLPLSSLWFSSPDFFLLSLSLPVGFRSTSTHTGYYQMTKVFWQCRYSKDTLTLVLSAAAGRQRCFRWLWAPSLTHTHQQQGLCALCSTAVNTSYQQPHTRNTTQGFESCGHSTAVLSHCCMSFGVFSCDAEKSHFNLSDWVCGFFLVWIIFGLQGCNCLQNIHCGTMEATRRLGNVTSCSHSVWMNLMHLSLVSLPSSRS